MVQSSDKIQVALEIGKKRTFASAIDWPGWSRSGGNEGSALQTLFDYAPRYARVLSAIRLDFRAPVDVSAFQVVERLEGNMTTDFGTPGSSPSSDARPVEEVDLRRFQALLEACWQAFDAAVGAAIGRELRKGPRGGGRDLEGIVQHVLDADTAYLGRLGWSVRIGEESEPFEKLHRIRKEILDGLASAVRHELPEQGPRGSLHWTPRYFVRRSVWHGLDHAWEIEDRII